MNKDGMMRGLKIEDDEKKGEKNHWSCEEGKEGLVLMEESGE